MFALTDPWIQHAHAILKSEKHVKGTATAASLWNTGAIGAAVAFHRYEIACVLSFVSFLTLTLGGRIGRTDEP